jgi:hypothetical protein
LCIVVLVAWIALLSSALAGASAGLGHGTFAVVAGFALGGLLGFIAVSILVLPLWLTTVLVLESRYAIAVENMRLREVAPWVLRPLYVILYVLSILGLFAMSMGTVAVVGFVSRRFVGWVISLVAG